MIRHLLLAACAGMGACAWAHPSFDVPEAKAGSYYKAVIKIGHGCDGSATRSIEVTIPEGVLGAHPMPKAGWQLKVEKAPLAKPYDSHGKTIKEDVRRVIWEGGSLPNDFYDEFVMQVKLPVEAGTLYWPVKQLCEQGEHDWREIPAAGEKSAHPAPKLTVLPNEHAGHAH
ncbi:YcnI family protein [Burkholderiaceae bacterium DAT-1]|nr:YcnI family protein [Burkholderiaceae bacterium DAT-1]